MKKHEAAPKAPQLNIKSMRARELAAELASLTGESLTDAVTAALQERLAREHAARRQPGEIANKLSKLAKEISAYPIKDRRTADEILGYDENGLPT